MYCYWTHTDTGNCCMESPKRTFVFDRECVQWPWRSNWRSHIFQHQHLILIHISFILNNVERIFTCFGFVGCVVCCVWFLTAMVCCSGCRGTAGSCGLAVWVGLPVAPVCQSVPGFPGRHAEWWDWGGTTERHPQSEEDRPAHSVTRGPAGYYTGGAQGTVVFTQYTGHTTTVVSVLGVIPVNAI